MYKVVVLSIVLLAGHLLLHGSDLDGRAILQPRAPLASERIAVQGLSRVVRFYKPAQMKPRPALVIALHGSGGDGERFRQFTGGAFDRLADEHGFLLAYPDALGGQWHDCRARAPYRRALAGVDDVAFLRAVAKRAAALAGGELSGVFAIGYSNGGHMAFRLASQAADDFAALAVIGAHMPVEGEFNCAAPRKPVSVLLVSGTSDPINPWRGGAVRPPTGASLGRVRSGTATVEYFRQLARARDNGTFETYPDRDKSDGSTVEARRWTGDSAEVTVLVVHGGGHTLPGSATAFPETVVGPTNRDIDGATVIWEFFAGRLAANR